MLAFCEVGFRIGLRYTQQRTPRGKDRFVGIQGAVLGLLSLLLAFTFAMAVDRYDTRRGLVLKEANAIGTTTSAPRFCLTRHRLQLGTCCGTMVTPGSHIGPW
jgi:hypothetical protein